MTQDQFADACGFSGQSRVGNYEAGRSVPSIEDLETMARVLHVDICEFFGSASQPARLDPEMMEDVIHVLKRVAGRFHEDSARDFARYYMLRAQMPAQPSTPRNTLEMVARQSEVGDGRDSPLHAVRRAAAGRKGKTRK